LPGRGTGRASARTRIDDEQGTAVQQLLNGIFIGSI
jgi:hypothetical protein